MHTPYQFPAEGGGGSERDVWRRNTCTRALGSVETRRLAPNETLGKGP
jgi:hypothetical protein